MSGPPEIDDITGALTRRAFLEHIGGLPAASLAVIDLEHPLSVGVTAEPGEESALLAQVGRLLRAGDGGATIGRVGYATFALVDPASDPVTLHTAVKQLLTRLGDTMPYWPGGAAGIAGWSTAGNSRRAFAAAILATREGHDPEHGYSVVFADTVDNHAADWAGRLRRALDDERLLLHAQPVYDLRTDALVSHELFVRMLDEHGNVVPAAGFMDAAVRYGLTAEIDQWVVRQALGLATAGHQVSVNLSPHSLRDERLSALLDEILGPQALRPVAVEVSERAIVGRRNIVLTRFLRRLADRGFPIGLDNFGGARGGSTSLLRELPLTTVKFDAYLLSTLREPSCGRQILDALIRLTDEIGMQTVAGNVDDPDLCARLLEAGIDQVQGYATGRPVTLAQAGLIAA